MVTTFILFYTMINFILYGDDLIYYRLTTYRVLDFEIIVTPFIALMVRFIPLLLVLPFIL